MFTIQLKNVTKKFGSVTAVNLLNLIIPEGSFVALLGPSGCGKTTTLRMIAGLEKPTAGEIVLGEKTLSSSVTGASIPPEKRGMGLVFQSYALWPHMTVSQNIVFGLQMQRKTRSDQHKRLAELSKLLHIEGLEDRYPLQLSGGQQQRVALARMLAISPQVLLLDEPLSNLDARLRIEMRAELKRLHENIGNTIIYVTHDQIEAMTMASFVAVIHNGELQQYAPPMDIYRRPRTLFVAEFVGSPPINCFRRNNPVSSHVFDSLTAYLMPDHAQVKDAHTIGIRPESISMIAQDAPIPEHRWCHPAVVDTILPTGPEWIVSARMNEQLVFFTTDAEPSLGRGEEVQLCAAPVDMHVFSEDQVRIDCT